MTSQPDETDDPIMMAPRLFREPGPGRPASSMSTAPTPAPDSSTSQSPSPAAPSTNPAPSWSTGAGPAEPSDPTPAPSGASPSEPEHSRSLTEQIARGLASMTETAHHALTDDVGRAHGLYLATEQELAAVAEGTASVVTRHMGPAVGSSEAADLVQIGLALGSYVTRTVRTWMESRRTRALIAEQTAQQQPAGA